MAASMGRAAHDIETRSRTDDVLLSEGIDFDSLLLSRPVLEGLAAAGFRKPFDSKSGTGKTCVFSTIALDSLILENVTTQIHSVVMAIGSAMEGLQCHVFIGGTALIELEMLSTASIRLFVLDEADKLLEEGSFQDQINWIFSCLPANKQMLALSATYPESLAQHLSRYMNEPTFVRLNPKDPALKGLRQYYKLVNSHAHAHKVFEEKVLHLLELFSKVPFNQALVCSPILHSKGGLSQDQRLEAMSKLKQYQCRVLISTDLTSRGIDAEKVNLVINLDVPHDWETYMHRIGRAGRFGTRGLAVTYCCHGEEENKMMAIAQRCSLTLSALPSPIEPGLMEESCDWGVSVEAAAPGTRAQLFPKQEKKKNSKNRKPAKVEAPDVPPSSSTAAASSSSDQEDTSTSSAPPRTKTSRATPEPRRVKVEVEQSRRPKKTTRPVERAHTPQVPAPPPDATPTRKELQDALPKIPPLSSFKTAAACSDLVTLEEAERDFHAFITEGPGRSVEVVRQFKGQSEDGGEDGGPSVRVELHMLHDDQDTVLKSSLRSSGRSAQPQPPPPMPPAVKMEVDLPSQRAAAISSSSSSSDDEDMEETQPRAKAPQGSAQTQSGTEAWQGSRVKPGGPTRRTKLEAVPGTGGGGGTATSSCRHGAGPDGGVLGPRRLQRAEPAHGGHHHRNQLREEEEEEERRPANPTRDERRTDLRRGAAGGKKKDKDKRVSDTRRRDEVMEGQTRGEDSEEEEEEVEEGGEEWSNMDDWRAYYRAWAQYYESMACRPPPAGYHGYYSQAQSWMAAYRMNTVYVNELLKH
ncbi:LOW QUALITY PROTEIN: hypothetical protein CRUP_034103 [Coryphaenoides rupestris]|nr:LOW QUALITY PROTEIN: hypothetical protein CRUP_034103 [Coryphaenoides rupestris]